MSSRLDTFYKYPDRFFPDEYLVIDIETTGFKPQTNYITQFGLVHVKDREPINKYGFLLKIPPGSMSAGAAEVTGLSEEICNEKGLAREEGIPLIHSTLTQWQGSRVGAVFVGYNLARFDIPFIKCEFEKLGLNFDVHPDELLDVGMIVKAEQVGTYPLVKEGGESIAAFNHRLVNYRVKGLKWSLTPYAVTRFNLEPRMKDSGLQSHDATADCLLTHWALESVRRERQEQMEKYAEHTGD